MNTSSNKLAKIKADTLDLIKEEIGKLSPIKKFLFETLFSRIFDIFSEDCSEDDVAQAVNSVKNVNSEYVRAEDYLNYDGAMRLFHYSSNRVGFVNLMKKHGIVQHTFRNQKIGFKKSELLALKAELDADRETKNKNKVVPKNTKPEKPYIGRINKLD